MTSRSGRLTRAAAIAALALVGAAPGCGGDDEDGGDAAAAAAERIDTPALTRNLEAAGYDVTRSDAGQIPTTVGSFATTREAGYQGAIAVSGKGLSAPGLDLSNTVTILVYASPEAAEKALQDLGGEEPARVGEGNRIYYYGGGVGDERPATLEEVVEASGRMQNAPSE